MTSSRPSMAHSDLQSGKILFSILQEANKHKLPVPTKSLSSSPTPQSQSSSSTYSQHTPQITTARYAHFTNGEQFLDRAAEKTLFAFFNIPDQFMLVKYN